MPHVRSFDETEIYYEATGRGPAVVFLPGINLSHEVWNREVTDLCGGFRCVAIDLRGHGRSAKPAGGYSYEGLARDVDAVLAALGVDACTLVGWSFGGAIALQCAIDHPARVSKLILAAAAAPRIAAAPEWPFGMTPADAQARIARELADRPGFRRAILESVFHEPPAGELLDWLWQLSMRTPSWASIACREALFHADLRARLGTLRAPTLIAHGLHDRHVPFGAAEFLQGRIGGATLLAFENSGHAPHLEEPERFGRALRDFLHS